MTGRRRGSQSSCVAAALGAVGLVAACAAHAPRVARADRPSLVAQLSSLPAFTTPAVWRYHPAEPARINAELELPGAERLLCGRKGERWLLGAGGGLQAAAVLAPEDLVGVSRASTGNFVFVGQSGVSYEARGPIAPFFRSSPPLEPLVSVTSSDSVILGIRRDRGLLRSDDAGTTWKPSGATRPGERAAQFVSVLLGAGGHGLALAVPEALYRTADAGQSFERVNSRSVGAFSLERLPDGSPGVVSALGVFRYRDGAEPVLDAVTSMTAAGRSELKAPRGPDARALSEGRAAASGGQYFELGMRDKAAWQLTSGALSAPLSTRDAPEFSACRAVRLSAFERALSVACFRSGTEAATQRIEFWASADGGRSFHAEPGPVEGNLTSFHMALGADGTLLLSGVCAPYSAAAGCAPAGIVRRLPPGGAAAPAVAARPLELPAKPSSQLAASATPSLADTALGLAFSLDGRVAYAVGRRTKGSVLAVFVSRDAGRSFEAQDVSLPTGDGEGADDRWESSATGARVDAIVPAEDGSVGVAIARYRARIFLVLDETGRVLSVARPPDPRALLAVAGSRALALSPATGEAWESLDGGASFQSLGRVPIELCVSDANCDVPVACVPAGCAIGGSLSRLGWGAQGEEDAWSQPAIAPAPVDYSVPRLKTPIACSLDASAWQGLAGVNELPRASEAAIGKAVWFAQGDDAAHAAAWIWIATGGTSSRVTREMLLGPSERGRGFALEVSSQIEGVAALRYQVPDGGANSHLTNVELGWTNLFEGRTRHAALADAGAYAPGDYVRGPQGLQAADPALLSIAEGGIYLRVHHAPGDNQPTLYFDGQKMESVPAVSWPNVGVRGTRSEMARIAGEHVPLLLVGRGSAVMRARRSANAQQLDAFASGAIDPARFGLAQNATIAYAGQHAGYLVETFDSAKARAEAQLFLFRAQGAVLDAPIDVPTQLSLADKVERCVANVEATTPRIVAAPYPGTRHPVLVSDGSDTPQAFLTSFAVLHGTPDAACVSAFDAEPVVPEGVPTPVTRAIVPFGDLGHAYLFRGTAQGSEVRVEYHGMACKLDPNAEVPPELYRAPGAVVPRAR